MSLAFIVEHPDCIDLRKVDKSAFVDLLVRTDADAQH